MADVVALLDAIELDRVRVMAHDWGALVGFLLCLYHPERVERYISLAIPHPFVTERSTSSAGTEVMREI